MGRTKRSYRQYCGLARALDVVGERWTLLVVRNLLLGPRRYSDLLGELPGITTNLLAKRLQELEAEELVEKVELPPPAASVVYRLTASGAALEPVVMELARWGGRHLGKPRRDDTVNLAWGLLSLKRRYLGGLSAVLGLDAGGRGFELAFSPSYLKVSEKPAERPDVSLHGEERAIQALFFGGVALPDLLATGALTVTGDASRLPAILAAFSPRPLPAPGLPPATTAA